MNFIFRLIIAIFVGLAYTFLSGLLFSAMPFAIPGIVVTLLAFVVTVALLWFVFGPLFGKPLFPTFLP